MVRLNISPALVNVSERGATIEFVGGRLWLRPDFARSLRSAEYKSVDLAVSLRDIVADGKRFTAVFVQGLGKVQE